MMMMIDRQYYLAESKHWEYRAEEHYVIAQASRGLCRRTMLNLAHRAEQRAIRAASLAVMAPDVENGMQTKSGLHPYRAGLFFILRENADEHRSSRKVRAAMVAGDINSISDWPMVRMLAHQFDKTARGVARDLAETYREMENGAPAP